MLSVVCFKWKPQDGYRTHFSAEHVNVMQRMVARNYPQPHRFFCVTDDPAGLGPEVTRVELWKDFAALRNPQGTQKPACYRRLKMFAPEAEKTFGKRFVCIDLDAIVTGDLRPLWNRTEDFIIWGDLHPRVFYNGSMWMMTAGARRQVWEEFTPHAAPRAAFEAGFLGSDQAWISYRLGRGEATWGVADGVYSYRVHIKRAPDRALPKNARVVFFHGVLDPWDESAQKLKWVRDHWR